MSCQNCDHDPLKGAYYCWGEATIEIIACKEHWMEIEEALNKAQELIKE